MPETFEPCLEVLPEAQRQIWPLLGFSSGLNFVLYRGTAVVGRVVAPVVGGLFEDVRPRSRSAVAGDRLL